MTPEAEAIARLRAHHRKYHGQLSRWQIQLLRRRSMAKRAPLGQHVRGFLDPRKHQDEKMNLQAISQDERKMGRVMGNRAPYRGSELERGHRRRGQS